MCQPVLLNNLSSACDTHAEVCVREVRDPEELSSQVLKWRDLARHAAEPNSFYESWFFLTAARQFGALENWRLYVVESGSGEDARWLGFFPMVLTNSGMGAGRALLCMWNHPQCFLNTPLIRRESVDIVLDALLDHLRDDLSAPGLIRFPKLTAMGAIQQSLVDIERRRSLTRYVRHCYNRALLSRRGWKEAPNAVEQYLKQRLGGHHARELRRQRRRLSDHGDLELRSLTHSGQIEMWVDWFLDLEDRSWKGRLGTSMKQHSRESSFFRAMITDGFREGRIEMLGLFSRGEPVALKCNLLADPGSFSFKIAFDEELSRFSPGVQLEIDHLNEFAESGRKWMDSCASAEHKMINRIWSDRIAIQDLILSTGRTSSELWLASLPLLRMVYRQVKSYGRTLRQSIPILRSNS